MMSVEEMQVLQCASVVNEQIRFSGQWPGLKNYVIIALFGRWGRGGGVLGLLHK